MKLLLDTHVFLWYISGDSRLPAGLAAAIRDPSNSCALSVASVWEAVVKHALGKLPLPDSPGVYLPSQRERHQIVSLPIDEGAVKRLAELPPVHRDPFDRIIVAQAQEFDLTILTLDQMVQAYPVKLFPAA